MAKNLSLKKKILLVIALFVLISFNANAADDNSEIDPNINGNLSVAKCLSKGNIDFITFLNASIFSDGLEGALEPWNDVLFRNACHASDVSGLIGGRDKLRSYIRDAFLTCNNQKIPELRKALAKMNAEIYYVRHVVDGNIVVSMPFSWLSTRQLEYDSEADKQSLYYSIDKLYAEIKKRYVSEDQIPLSDFDLFFNKLQLKYKDKAETYILCESGSWSEVAKKWDEFWNSNFGTKEALKNLKKGVNRRAEKIVDAASDMTFSGFFTGLVQTTLNNQEPQAGFSEIIENAAKFAPSGSSVTQDTAFNAVKSAGLGYDINEIRAKMASNFEFLYKQTSDASVSIFMDELTNLDNAIVNSLDPLSRLQSCSEKIDDKQCPQKK